MDKTKTPFIISLRNHFTQIYVKMGKKRLLQLPFLADYNYNNPWLSLFV